MNQKMNKKQEEKAVALLIDSSALKDMFEGKNSGKELLEKMTELNNKGIEIKAMTPMASFLRAIYLADPETKIQPIQKALNFLDIAFSMADFKSEEQTRNEIIKIAGMITKYRQEQK
jgi:hypothetical protein